MEEGEPDGRFFDNAMDLIYEAIPAPDKEEVKAMMLAACRSLNAYGVTSSQTDDYCAFHNVPWPLVNEAYRELEAEGRLTVRVYEQSNFTSLEALKALCVRLARMMAKDGEGARHLITCTVSGAKDEESAQTIAKSVISSTLTKAAIFGCDANWGRVLCAMGYSGEDFDPDKVDVAFASAAGEIPVCRQGRGLDFDEDLAKRILTEDEVEIRVRMGEGDAACTCWGCDITYDYIKINGDYRT